MTAAMAFVTSLLPFGFDKTKEMFLTICFGPPDATVLHTCRSIQFHINTTSPSLYYRHLVPPSPPEGPHLHTWCRRPISLCMLPHLPSPRPFLGRLRLLLVAEAPPHPPLPLHLPPTAFHRLQSHGNLRSAPRQRPREGDRPAPHRHPRARQPRDCQGGPELPAAQ